MPRHISSSSEGSDESQTGDSSSSDSSGAGEDGAAKRKEDASAIGRVLAPILSRSTADVADAVSSPVKMQKLMESAGYGAEDADDANPLSADEAEAVVSLFDAGPNIGHVVRYLARNAQSRDRLVSARVMHKVEAALSRATEKEFVRGGAAACIGLAPAVLTSKILQQLALLLEQGSAIVSERAKRIVAEALAAAFSIAAPREVKRSIFQAVEHSLLELDTLGQLLATGSYALKLPVADVLRCLVEAYEDEEELHAAAATDVVDELSDLIATVEPPPKNKFEKAPLRARAAAALGALAMRGCVADVTALLSTCGELLKGSVSERACASLALMHITSTPDADLNEVISAGVVKGLVAALPDDREGWAVGALCNLATSERRAANIAKSGAPEKAESLMEMRTATDDARRKAWELLELLAAFDYADLQHIQERMERKASAKSASSKEASSADDDAVSVVFGRKSQGPGRKHDERVFEDLLSRDVPSHGSIESGEDSLDSAYGSARVARIMSRILHRSEMSVARALHSPSDLRTLMEDAGYTEGGAVEMKPLTRPQAWKVLMLFERDREVRLKAAWVVRYLVRVPANAELLLEQGLKIGVRRLLEDGGRGALAGAQLCLALAERIDDVNADCFGHLVASLHEPRRVKRVAAAALVALLDISDRLGDLEMEDHMVNIAESGVTLGHLKFLLQSGTTRMKGPIAGLIRFCVEWYDEDEVRAASGALLPLLTNLLQHGKTGAIRARAASAIGAFAKREVLSQSDKADLVEPLVSLVGQSRKEAAFAAFALMQFTGGTISDQVAFTDGMPGDDLLSMSKRVIAAGAVPHLAEAVRGDRTGWVAAALHNLVASKRGAKAVVKADAVEALVEVLSAPPPADGPRRLPMTVAQTLERLTAHKSLRAAVVSAGAIKPLIEALQEDRRICAAAGALNNLARHKKFARKIVRAGAVGPLAEMLVERAISSNLGESERVKAAEALGRLCAGHTMEVARGVRDAMKGLSEEKERDNGDDDGECESRS